MDALSCFFNAGRPVVTLTTAGGVLLSPDPQRQCRPS